MKYTNKAEYTLAVVKGIINLIKSESRPRNLEISQIEIQRVITNPNRDIPEVKVTVQEYFNAGKEPELATHMLYRAYNKYLQRIKSEKP